MARAMWTGFLSFGLVNVPVGLYSATEDQTLHFNQLHKGTSNRIRYRKVDEVTGEEVETADIVNGYPISDGEYVIVSREELKEAAAGRSESIEITDFVELDRIDPVYFRQSYYLAPRGKGADRAYALLRRAMRESNRVGIATVVLRDKEHLVAVRPGEDVLIMETMYFSDEVRDVHEELDDLPDGDSIAPRELEIAKQLIESLAAEWKPAQYTNSYRTRVEELIAKKSNGQAIVARRSDQPKSNVIDLMAALEASVAKSRGARTTPEVEVEKSKPARTARSRTSPSAGEQQTFAGMSKAELLERAAALDLQGRSKMSKLELVQALTEATEPPKRRSRRAS